MSSNLVDRAAIRKQFTTFLTPYLVGTGKPVEAIYEYQVGDFGGRNIVTIVTGAGTDRGSLVEKDDTTFYLEVHNFVLYAIKPVPATNDLSLGLSVVIDMTNTSLFEVGSVVTVEDSLSSEMATVTNVVDNVSITVDELVNNYVKPTVSIWTELQSEDMIDLLEKLVSDAVVDANDEDNWSSAATDGRSEPDVVDIGGNPYRHEIIPIAIVLSEYVWAS